MGPRNRITTGLGSTIERLIWEACDSLLIHEGDGGRPLDPEAFTVLELTTEDIDAWAFKVGDVPSDEIMPSSAEEPSATRLRTEAPAADEARDRITVIIRQRTGTER